MLPFPLWNLINLELLLNKWCGLQGVPDANEDGVAGQQLGAGRQAHIQTSSLGEAITLLKPAPDIQDTFSQLSPVISGGHAAPIDSMEWDSTEVTSATR